MSEFDYQAPQTIEDALAFLNSAGEGVRILAGGTDLIVKMRVGASPPKALLDLKRVQELRRIEYGNEDGLVVGAAATCAEIAAHEHIRLYYPALAEAAGMVGGVAIRNRATIGGNLCNAAPSADTVPPLIVLSARCVIAGLDGIREIPAEDFCTGPGACILKQGEILTEIKIPKPRESSGSQYLRFIPRGEMDIAVAGVAAFLLLDKTKSRISAARVALAAVAPVPLLVPEVGDFLAGKEPNGEIFSEAAKLAKSAAHPIDDMRGSGAYRYHIVEVLTRRALEDAFFSATGGEINA